MYIIEYQQWLVCLGYQLRLMRESIEGIEMKQFECYRVSDFEIKMYLESIQEMT